MDILAHINNRILSILVLVECKRYAPERPVGVGVVREVYGVQKMHYANKSLIVTTSHFTKPAIEEHRRIESETELKDYEDLKLWLGRYLVGRS